MLVTHGGAVQALYLFSCPLLKPGSCRLCLLRWLATARLPSQTGKSFPQVSSVRCYDQLTSSLTLCSG
jgi:hypothetical protein